MSFNNSSSLVPTPNKTGLDIFIFDRSDPFTFSLIGLASLFSILSNGYVICIIKVLTSKENSLAILNLSILEILSSLTTLLSLFAHGHPEFCRMIYQLHISLFVIGLYSVGYVNMEIYLKIFEPFSDSLSNSRLLGIISSWSSGIVTLVLVRCFGHSICGFIGDFVTVEGFHSKKRKHTEISSNFSTLSSSSSSHHSSKECLRVIVLKASATATRSAGHRAYTPNSRSIAKTTVVIKRSKNIGLCFFLSDDRKMLVSSGILIIVFLIGQFLPSILTVINLVQWKEFLTKEVQREIEIMCRCFVAVFHPLIYGILRENIRNLFKMLQKRRNRSLS
ncbi:unnamed protein product [Lepeophtheirus salmonis]|uniref:(salmon louse) hypothetical protein n=1 Tax=Lepeophtheirus salmonis TaxID=72036 RepID=A0A7R8D314_LEPSM|nr:unnamed protein product [Lepeophtheirus salmonis]CAF3012283.1 unnamed protein product [Lepeophtheirus salmonis]